MRNRLHLGKPERREVEAVLRLILQSGQFLQVVQITQASATRTDQF